MNFRSLFVLLLMACLITLSACSRKTGPSDMPKLHSCKIAVTLNGAPLDDAIVHCQPVTEEKSKWYGSGATDANGNAVISTLSQYSGLSEGEYKVTIVKSIPDPRWVPKEDEMAPAISALDDKFADDHLTPLRCTIVPGKNEFSFEVTPRDSNTSPTTN